MSGRQVGYVVGRSLGFEVTLRHTWTSSPGRARSPQSWRMRHRSALAPVAKPPSDSTTFDLAALSRPHPL